MAIGCTREAEFAGSRVFHLYEVVPGGEMRILSNRCGGVDRCEGDVPALTLMINLVDGETRREVGDVHIQKLPVLQSVR